MAHLYYAGILHLDPQIPAIQTITFGSDCRMRVVHRNRYRARRLDIRRFAVVKMKTSGDAAEILRGDANSG
jgi:hypothetical protein